MANIIPIFPYAMISKRSTEKAFIYTQILIEIFPNFHDIHVQIKNICISH